MITETLPASDPAQDEANGAGLKPAPTPTVKADAAADTVGDNAPEPMVEKPSDILPVTPPETPDSLPQAVVEAQPIKPRIEVKTVVQEFRVNQPEKCAQVNEQYAQYLNDGWREADCASVLNPVGDTYQFVRVVTFKREAK